MQPPPHKGLHLPCHLEPGCPKSHPPGTAPQGSRAALPAGRYGAPRPQQRLGRGLRGDPTPAQGALPTCNASWQASSAPTALQMWPRKLYRRQRMDTCRQPCPGHRQNSLGQRDRLLQPCLALRDARAEQPHGLPQPSPALGSHSERAAIQHSVASIQRPQDMQPGSPAKQADGQAAEPLPPRPVSPAWLAPSVPGQGVPPRAAGTISQVQHTQHHPLPTVQHPAVPAGQKAPRAAGSRLLGRLGLPKLGRRSLEANGSSSSYPTGRTIVHDASIRHHKTEVQLQTTLPNWLPGHQLGK